jgi:hypothetical protein
MADLFHGIGDPFIKTKSAPAGPGQNIILPLEIFSFDFSTDSNSLEAKSQKKGIIRTIASAVGESTGTLKLSSQYGNWGHLGFFLNQLPTVVAEVSIPVLKTGTVPSESPYEITDAGITTATVDGIFVYLFDGQDSQYLKKVGTTPTGYEVEVDTTAHKLIFPAALDGKLFTYTIPVTETNVQRYGGATGDKYGTIEFWGTIYGTEDRIHFPSLDFKTTPSISLTGDVATLEVDFSANVSSGDDEPYVIYKAA